MRIKPIVLKNIRLMIKGEDDKQEAMSFYLQKDYEQLEKTCMREEEFIYDNFAEGREGRIIVDANDNQCLSKWFPIKLTNKKDDLAPLDSVKPRIIKL